MSRITDEIADAIIGALLIAHYAGKAGRTIGNTVRGIEPPLDVTPSPDAQVFTPSGKPPTRVTPRRASPATSAYHGAADRMERQSKRVVDQTETVPGEFD